MKNILRIIRHDLRKISGSVVAIITIMGLCIIPCLYAWFNIFSNWAPYESDATGRISVAIANSDEGYTAAGITVNVGDKIVEALKANDAIGWQFVDSEETAKERVYAGDCYAAIVIPEDFSCDVLSFARGDLTNPKIKYYENEKKNAIAPKITGKAKTALQEQVNATFVETLAGYVSDAASVAEAGGADPASMLSDMSEKAKELSRDVDSCIALSDSAAGLTGSAGSMLDVSENFIGSTQDVISANDLLLAEAEKQLNDTGRTDTKSLETASKRIKTTAASLKTLETVMESLAADNIAFGLFIDNDRDKWVSRVDGMQRDAKEQAGIVRAEGFTALADRFEELAGTLGDISSSLSGLDKSMTEDQRRRAVRSISADIKKAEKQTDAIIEQIRTDIDTNLETALANSRKSISKFRKAMTGAGRDLGTLSDALESYGGSLDSLRSSIDKTTASLKSLQRGANTAADLLSDASGSELLQRLNELAAGDEAAVAEYLANPVKMDTKVFWPIETYGSAMAPFYTVLAQWVGALLTAVLIKVRLKNRHDYPKLRLHEWFFGRYGLYMLVGLAQGLIVSLGDLLYIHIQCTAPLRFVLIACINGMVFMMINYALVFALDNIGLGAGVIILVLQVAGSGGTYPVEVLPHPFRVLYPFMPFRYSMDAMRECIGGMYDGTYWKCAGVLMIFFVFSVAFGLAFYRPARKLNEMIAISKAKSEIML